MSKKHYDTNAISNELSGGASLFFQQKKDPEEEKQRPSPSTKKKQLPATQDVPPKRYHDITNDVMISDNMAVIEAIRKTVKHVGKETTPLRLTPEEKSQLADIVYTYKRQGIRTSENEINRIGINFLLEDYRTNGKDSILARVLDA